MSVRAVDRRSDGAPIPVAEVYRELVEKGHLAGCKPAAHLIRFYPPLIIGKDDIARLGESLDHILGDAGQRIRSCLHSL